MLYPSNVDHQARCRQASVLYVIGLTGQGFKFGKPKLNNSAAASGSKGGKRRGVLAVGECCRLRPAPVCNLQHVAPHNAPPHRSSHGNRVTAATERTALSHTAEAARTNLLTGSRGQGCVSLGSHVEFKHSVREGSLPENCITC